MQSLKPYLSLLYGEQSVQQVRSYARSSIKHSKYINNLAFLKRCRDSKVIPPGLRLQDPIRNHHSSRILHQASLALLRERIVSTRSLLSHLDKDIAATETSLQTTLSTNDYTKIHTLTAASSKHAFTTTRNKQIRKFAMQSVRKMRSSLSLSPRCIERPEGSPISQRPTRPPPHPNTPLQLTYVPTTHRR